jgi:DNA-directed RNA polymerase subunit M/transcription elongation factor TFIIS
MASNIIFCPNCASILKIKKLADNTTIKFCSCGYKLKIEEINSTKFSEKMKNKKMETLDLTENKLAVFDHICKKCGYNKAEIIERGTQYSDEDDMTFFKCGKCGYMEMNDAKVT